MGFKVGVFSDSYKPYTSGVVRSIDTFKEELTTMGYETYIFAPDYKNSQKESGVFRFKSIPAPTHPEFTLAIPFSLGLKSTITELGLNIIHVHSPFLLGRVGAYYAKRNKLPLVFTFHSFYEQYVHYVPINKNITKALVKRFCSEFANNCDAVIAPSVIAQEYLLKIGVKTPVKVIPTGIPINDYERYDPSWLRENYSIPEGSTVLLFVGRLGKEKNLAFILDVFNKYIVGHADAVLVIAGGGPEENTLKELAGQLDISHRVVFTGNLSKQDVINCYHGADIFVFASVTETQGLVIGEAKAAGLPVVAVNKNGAAEMVEDGQDGFLTDLNARQFAGKIMELITNLELRGIMSEHAKKNAELISSRNCAIRLVECYKELL
jgi:glycosyltransferase involved in cell wall biosynthesis